MFSDIDVCCISESATLLEAMRVIDRGAAGIALVIDADRRLLGILTDGDIRRAIISGAALDSGLGTYIQKEYLCVTAEAGRAEVLDLMQSRLIDQVPVLDAEKRLVGLHLLHGLIGSKERVNWAVIMAGGKGTRLRPITEHLPKPMVKVAGKPILERLILHLVGYGIRRVFLSINYLGHVVEDYFGDGSKWGCSIEYLREEEPLGTGGALSLLPETPSTATVVMNGDLLVQTDIQALLEIHGQGSNFLTMGVKSYQHQVEFGCVNLADDGVITRLEEKPLLERYINAGIYVLSPEAVAMVPSRAYSITELFQHGMENGKRCGSYYVQTEWQDIGRPSHLAQARGL